MKNEGVVSLVSSYAAQEPVRFHMPGHGGVGYNSLTEQYFKYDITENGKTDNLYSPMKDGFVECTLKKIESSYNSPNSILSAHGATSCVQAAIYCCTILKGRKFFLHRKCHVSVINALALCGADAVYFEDIDDLKCRLSQEPNSTIVLTSPDYYGQMLDIREFSKLCHKFSSYLIVDNSHGAHLPWCGNLHPILLGTDFSIDSLHKTTPSLTGSAILHSSVASREFMLEAIKLFVSTSPSYLIAASADGAVDFMNTFGKERIEKLIKAINDFAVHAAKYGIIRETYDIYDPCRITLASADIKGKQYDMTELCAFLESKNIVPEFASKEKCVLIPSVFVSDNDFSALLECIKEFVTNAKLYDTVPFSQYPVAKRAISIRRAVFSHKINTKAVLCEGKISACTKYVYPPGIPIITPGDIIDKEIISALLKVGITDVDIVDEKCKT